MLCNFDLSHLDISGNVFIYRRQRYTSDHEVGSQQDHEHLSISAKGFKDYLTARFLIGEKTGCKAYPNQVEKDMRTSRNPSNECKFICIEWLKKTQIKEFISRLAASRCKENGLVGMSLEHEDVECLVKDSERQELSRASLMNLA